ncbi:hypothetical protein LXT21_35865 [Myxococcus sp. K38C18041901]|uniref:hypothetical protein n=1 Tax=Myxococcus guangdongensis TaxID=2906760 RepID=UPI0020A7D469|nr:hypothetical protein [Myxococcus guangdongensis]MCP3064163.1 hypothetical protein [Myxococcus guangdongensis]
MFPDLATRVVPLDEIKARFEAANEAETFGWFVENFGHSRERAGQHDKPVPEIHLVTGPVRLEKLVPKSPWILVVDGDLEVAGDIDLSTSPYDISLFVVFGEVRARNLRFSGSACCYVTKSVELTGGCFGDHGDESAELHTARLKARVLMLDGNTGVNATELDAVVFASEGWGLPLHFTSKDVASEVFVPEALKGDSFHEGSVWKLMVSGKDPFLPGALGKLRARHVEAEDRLKPL